MFANNRMQSEIDAIRDSDTLYSFLDYRSKYILPSLESLITKIRSLNGNFVLNSSILNLLFFERRTFIGYEYTVLDQYINATNLNLDLFYQMTSDQRNLCLLLYSPEKIHEIATTDSNLSINWNSIQKDFLHEIFDIYIPSYESVTIIDSLVDNGIGLDELISKSYTENDSMNTSEYQLLKRYINDIYSHDESKQDAFVDMHTLDNITKSFINRVEAVSERYNKYIFPDTDYETNDYEIKYLVYSTFFAFANPDANKDTVGAFISGMKNQFIKTGSSDLKILELFLGELLDIASDFIDSYHYESYKDSIHEFVYKDTINADDDDEGQTKTAFESFDAVMEDYKKNSVNIHKTQNKIYKAYRNYKDNQDKVDSQMSKAVEWGKKLLIGDVKTEIIEGKKFSAMSLLKSALASAALFSVNWMAALIAIAVKYALKKSVTMSERKKIILELEGELEMIDEKIEDAKSDGDREAKYSMMRTRTELKNALDKIKYGVEADQKSVNTAKSTIRNVRSRW